MIRLTLLLLGLLLATPAGAWAPPWAAPANDPLTLLVEVPWPGASAAVVEARLVRPLEAGLRGLPGLAEVESLARAELAILRLHWAPGVHREQALLATRERLTRLDSLPEAAGVPRLRVDVAGFVVATVVVRRGGPDSLDPAVIKALERRLGAVPGVAEVEVSPRAPAPTGVHEDVVDLIVRRGHGQSSAVVLKALQAAVADFELRPGWALQVR